MHIIFIDSLNKLNTKKDSSLMLGLTLKLNKEEVYLLFEEDFNIFTQDKVYLSVYDFAAKFEENSMYLKEFSLTQKRKVCLGEKDVIHMRIDPPFDSRYLKFLWMLDFLVGKGILVVNQPKGILSHNEKILAYSYKDWSIPSFIGSNLDDLLAWASKQDCEHLIMKPLDLFQGMGVEKVKNDSQLIKQSFSKRLNENSGTLVIQPFMKSVEEGEVRAVYFKGKELGSILKVPPKGKFLANIAQGASYRSYELSTKERMMCEKVCLDLMEHGIYWIAFDLLAQNLSEINITCPGLMVEVCSAHKKNLFNEMIEIGF